MHMTKQGKDTPIIRGYFLWLSNACLNVLLLYQKGNCLRRKGMICTFLTWYEQKASECHSSISLQLPNKKMYEGMARWNAVQCTSIDEPNIWKGESSFRERSSDSPMDGGHNQKPFIHQWYAADVQKYLIAWKKANWKQHNNYT